MSVFVTTPLALLDMILWFFASIILLILAIIRYRRMRQHQQLFSLPLPPLRSPPRSPSPPLAPSLSPSPPTRTSPPFPLPLPPPASAPSISSLPRLRLRSHNYIQDTLPKIFLLMAILLFQRCMGLFTFFYGTDTRAQIFQAIGIITSNFRTWLDYMIGAGATYVTLSVAYVSITLSPLPRVITLVYVLISLVWFCGFIWSVVMQMLINKKWPAGVQVSLVATVISIWYITFAAAVLKLTSLLICVPGVDGPSRVRTLERSGHLRRGLFYGGIVILLAVASCLYLAIPILRNTDAPYLQEQHWISYSDWAQMLFYAWMMWYFWLPASASASASALPYLRIRRRPSTPRPAAVPVPVPVSVSVSVPAAAPVPVPVPVPVAVPVSVPVPVAQLTSDSKSHSHPDDDDDDDDDRD